MAFSIRPFHRFPVQWPMPYNASLLLKLPLASCSCVGSDVLESNGTSLNLRWRFGCT